MRKIEHMRKIERALKASRKAMIVDVTKICDAWLNGQSNEETIISFIRLLTLG